MQIQTAGTVSGVAVGLCAAGALAVWPDQKWIAEAILGVGVAIIVITWGWWLCSKLLRGSLKAASSPAISTNNIVGGDNTGPQTIIHGPVTIHNALPLPHPAIPAPPKPMRPPFSNANPTVRSYEKPNLARHTLHAVPDQLHLYAEFDEKILGCKYPTQFTDGSEATYFRIKVTNNTPEFQRGCRGTLAKIERKDEFGDFVETGFADRIVLVWVTFNSQIESRFIDLPIGESAFLDVFYCTALGRIVICTKSDLPIAPFNENGTYRLTINISSEGTAVEPIALIFVWTGEFGPLRVKRG